MNSLNLTYAKRLAYTKFGFEKKTILEVLEMIRRGDMKLYDSEFGEYDLKTITEVIRRQPDPSIQNELKARFLPVVFFNGVWDGSKISEYSCMTALDFDHIHTDDELLQTLARLKDSPFVLAIFRTFKTRRIKALVMHDNTDPNKHKELYEQLLNLFDITLLDTGCNDLSRKTYLPWDEDVWLNPNCGTYHFVPAPALVQPRITTPINKQRGINYAVTKSKSPYSIINILNSSWKKNHPEYWQRGYRALSIFKCACQLCIYGVPQNIAEDYFLNGGWIASDFTSEEAKKQVHGAYSYNANKFGSKDFI